MRVRVSRPAKRDLAGILATSNDRWGAQAYERYAALIAGAVRLLERAPHGPLTRDRAELSTGLRSLHLGHVRGAGRVIAPVHVIFYRIGATAIELVRVLHERMEPTMHLR